MPAEGGGGVGGSLPVCEIPQQHEGGWHAMRQTKVHLRYHRAAGSLPELE